MIKAGNIYSWVGLRGQYDTDRLIRMDSMAADCGINALILDLDGEFVEFITIPLADAEAAIRLGCLVHVASMIPGMSVPA